MAKIRIKNKQRNNIANWVRICCLSGALVAYSASAFAAVMANTTLPTGGQWAYGSGSIVTDKNNPIMNITQKGQNAVIKWGSFDIGSMATVNFGADKKYDGGFNILNYVNGGSMSQIHGTMKADGGNVYLINPAGVFIGKSAQIEVGSLYVSNQKMTDGQLNNFYNGGKTPTVNGAATAAELMSLGHIHASNVTFKGDRVVIDMDRVHGGASNDDSVIKPENVKIYGDADNVVVGYTGYDEKNKTFLQDGKESTFEVYDKVNEENYETQKTKVKGYMWIENLEQLQAMNTNLSGNYALHNGIDATETNADLNKDGYFKFEAIGKDGAAFTGKFDGLANNIDGVNFSIFDLNIYANNGVNGTENLGLFGVTDGATIRNLTFVSGGVHSNDGINTTTNHLINAGMVAGKAIDSTISNITSSASVTGNNTVHSGHIDDRQKQYVSQNIGGIVGYAEKTEMTDLYNTGHIQGYENVGGLVGKMSEGILKGDSSNIGQVKGVDDTSIKQEANAAFIAKNTEKYYSHNIGGLVGYAEGAALEGTEENKISNNLTVQGGYNVGGIVGNAVSTNITNALNTGNITANGHIYENYYYFQGSDNQKVESVSVANAGGIAGNVSGKSSLTNVTNDGGDVTSIEIKNALIGKDSNGQDIKEDIRLAGNIGGIVGRAGSSTNDGAMSDSTDTTDITIKNALNKENHVYGAHNVGGIAGYLDNGTVKEAINNGGEILGTGAHNVLTNYAQLRSEAVRSGNGERFNIGNLGGIVGYMYGNNAFVSNSGNRGLVHSADITDNNNIPNTSKIANVGGIVGKINRSETGELNKDKELVYKGTNDKKIAAVSNSYNTGEVQGYTGVGGIVGMMYNGEVTSSYNEGTLRSTRTSASNIDALNMGGIVGDTTEETAAKALIYDVYNSGTIGDSSFNYKGRHIGGIVGRLSGNLEKAYNTGAVYNNFNVVGGVVGWWANGDISNVFNTGNVTVKYTPDSANNNASSQVGGIVGAVELGFGDRNLTNAYNLGTIRAFGYGNNVLAGAADRKITASVGGIIGYVANSVQKNDYNDKDSATGNYKNRGKLNIKNVYTTGNLYAQDERNDSYTTDGDYVRVGAIYGRLDKNGNPVNAEEITISNAYYITPENPAFNTLYKNQVDSNGNVVLEDIGKDGVKYTTNGVVKVVKFDERYEYKYNFGDASNNNIDDSNGNRVNTKLDWRIYANSLPILNAFLPKAEEYFGKDTTDKTNINSIQYGTAYNPLLTIINAKDNLAFEWGATGLNAGKNDSFAVYGGGLTLNGFTNTGYYGGTLYSDGALTINTGNADLNLGSASKLYGSSVVLDAGTGAIDSYGSVTATGNVKATDDANNGDVIINGSEIESLGTITSAGADETLREDKNGNKVVHISGIENHADHDHTLDLDYSNVADPGSAMPETGDMFAHDVKIDPDVKGDVKINVTGDADLLYGVNEAGKITTGGDLIVNAGGDVYVDADLSIGGNINLTAPGEIVLDISNVGKVGAADEKASVKGLHTFLDHFKNGVNNKETITMTGKEAMITIDMWDSEAKKFNLNKYDISDDTSPTGKGHTIAEDFGILNLVVNGKNNIDGQNNGLVARDTVHIWISDADQLAGIQKYAEGNADSGILSYNFAMKNNIDANGLKDYKAIGNIGDGKQFTGIFNGRGNSIIGLDVDSNVSGVDVKENYAGIFGVIGEGGTVKNMSIISSNFAGGSVGAVAGLNRGTISDINTFGNRVQSSGTVENDYLASTVIGVDTTKFGMAGGIVGLNRGTIEDATVQDTVVAGTEGQADVQSTAGGVVGYNVGDVKTSAANSAVAASGGGAQAIGGVVGINNDIKVDDNTHYTGTLTSVESLGIVNGIYHSYSYDAAGAVVEDTKYSDNVGGIAGVNYSGAIINNAYNEAHVTGKNAVGGVVGFAGGDGSKIENVINSGYVTSSGMNVGGIVGSNGAASSAGADSAEVKGAYINGGRNTGTVKGVLNVGGVAGFNYIGTEGQDGKTGLNNIINDGFANIEGVINVGGVAGYNKGDINAENSNLVNNGKIYGWQNVGGIAGTNVGTIVNTVTDMDLNVVEKNDDVTGEYILAAVEAFEKVSGEKIVYNKDVPNYFGGVVGHNTANGTITNATNSGNITAEDGNYVGGIVGLNEGKLTTSGKDASGKNNVVGNSGTVIGNNYVGGVAGENRYEYSVDDIDKDSDMHHITNSGTVIALGGGAAGIFGVNRGNLKYVEMVNSGTVLGSKLVSGDVAGTGGVIGVNYATVDHSSLINTTTGVVAGEQNVGGLIGINYGSVAGGRDTDDVTTSQYYKYQIYNNGEVTGGTVTITKDKNGKVDYKIDTTKGNTVGGLIGNNGVYVDNSDPSNTKTYIGSLTAGYNTGTVQGGSNVGSIAGNNAGTIDQVFSTTAVDLVGDKASNGTISNAYYTVDGKNVYVSTSKDDLENKDIWKKYASNDNYLLSVFLTNATVEFDPGFKSTYDGKEHKFTFGQDIVDNGNGTSSIEFYYQSGNEKVYAGTITVAGPDSAHNLQDYINSYEGNENDLLQSVVMKNAGKYDEILYSSQINTNGKKDADGNYNPNNLGFNIVSNLTNQPPELKVDQAELNINLDYIWRTYGDALIHNKVTGGNDYGYTIDTTGWTDEMKAELNGIISSWNYKDGSDDGLDPNRVTNDVGNYTWEAEFTVGNNNYKIGSIKEGISEVVKAKLEITVDDIIINKGQSLDGKFKGDKGTIVNGDNFDIYFGIGQNNSGLVNQPGTHKGVLGIIVNGKFYDLNNNSGIETVFSNYNLDVTYGNLIVNGDDTPKFWEAEDKYAWGKKREERERKAEVYFVDGGMTL